MRVSFSAADAPGAMCAHVHAADELELSRIVPLLESVGFTVVSHASSPSGQETEHRFSVRATAWTPDPDADGPRLARAVQACWHGWCDADALNRLVGSAGLEWTEVALLRAYRHYQRHLRASQASSPTAVDEALCANPGAAALLAAFFLARFGDSGRAVQDLRERILAACDATDRLEHDQALRRMLGLMEATLATNARLEATAEQPAAPLALKFDSARVPDLPGPVPYREIYVFSAALEGVHLRGGPVARGGIRWSERAEDLRDEVLALMRAQMLKNALIVPTGAKGGFLLRDRVAGSVTAEDVREGYLAFVGALLDVTGADDPYLVVAADKGTATFSDAANDLAARRGFWMGDAFASGGSRGYDHKALGITARGAWAAARQHLLELGVRPGVDPITVAGIGDMSGDVFGNGMVLVEGLRLIAAFDHRDIFLDPDPDPVRALAERRRLQALPRSSWQDYDRDAISPGGGVFSRSLKRVELTPEVRAALRVTAEALTPAELIRAVLGAPVDVLFAGGIGTYVRAAGERDADIGDRGNDAVRIDAGDLRARVYVEGANLSITQAARIQYARRGGRVNQDAIDNAAGVAISDREVNAKILLRAAPGCGEDEAAGLLAGAAGDVVAGVLDDVTQQAVCLAAEQRAAGREASYERLMAALERTGLDRAAELLPSSAEMASRAELGAGLARPELATLLAHAKRRLIAAVLQSGLPDRPALTGELLRYFPPALTARAGEAVEAHSLRRELVATRLANDLVNRLGIAFAFDVAEEDGASLAAVCGAYWVAREVTGARAAWDRLLELQEQLGMERFIDLRGRVNQLVVALMRQMLAEERADAVLDEAPDTLLDRDRDGFTQIRAALPVLGALRRRRERQDAAARLGEELGDEGVAWLIAGVEELSLAPEALALARERGRSAVDAAEAYLVLGEHIGAPRVARLLERAEADGEWALRQRRGLAEDWAQAWRAAAATALDAEPDAGVLDALRAFLDARKAGLASSRDVLAEIERQDRPTLDMAAVAVRALRRALAGAPERS